MRRAQWAWWVVALVVVGFSVPVLPSTASPALTPVGVPGVDGFPTGAWQLKANHVFAAPKLDTKVWAPNWLGSTDTAVTTGYQLTYDQNCFNPRDVVVRGGILQLLAKKETCVDEGGGRYGYSAGTVNSFRSGTFTYGYVEGKVYFPVNHCAAGDAVPKRFMCIENHPAFWLDSYNPANPGTTRAEIDIAEGLQGKLCQLFHFTAVGYVDHNLMHCSIVAAAGWHVYGVSWTPGRLQFFVDGKLAYDVATPQGFSDPMYVLANNAVPTHWVPTTPAAMKVAYVRVWAQKTAS
jgi:beta-glucanase (GH16 family)